jgi:hypothetical protein
MKNFVLHLYYRFLYRRLQILAHRFNWHHTRTIYPEGDTMVLCDWCGLRCVTKRASYPKHPPIHPATDNRQFAAGGGK